jgi:hypothetical protein
VVVIYCIIVYIILYIIVYIILYIIVYIIVCIIVSNIVCIIPVPVSLHVHCTEPLGAFPNCEKRQLATICPSVCPSARSRETTRLPLDGVLLNLMVKDFLKICR